MFDVTGSVMAGRPGGEVSWGLIEFLEVRVGQSTGLSARAHSQTTLQYAVKLTLDAMDELPAYRCDHFVQTVTDEAHAFEVDDDAREQPALGLINLQAPRAMLW